jgi:hypothetical protein
MATRQLLVIGSGGLLAICSLVLLGQSSPNVLPSLLAEGSIEPWITPSSQDPSENAPEFSLEEKIRSNGFFYDQDRFSYVNGTTTLQKLCDILGCKPEDFVPPTSVSFTYSALDIRDTNAWHLKRNDFVCYVWIIEHPVVQLSQAKVRTRVWLLASK